MNFNKSRLKSNQVWKHRIAMVMGQRELHCKSSIFIVECSPSISLSLSLSLSSNCECLCTILSLSQTGYDYFFAFSFAYSLSWIHDDSFVCCFNSSGIFVSVLSHSNADLLFIVSESHVFWCAVNKNNNKYLQFLFVFLLKSTPQSHSVLTHFFVVWWIWESVCRE